MSEEPDRREAEIAAQPPEDPAPESPAAPDVNFTSRVTGKVQITGEEPVEDS